MPKRHSNKVGDLESLFLRLEELVLANSGEDEFEEVFKLLIAKLWDERAGSPSRFKVQLQPADTAAAVSSLLREADKHWPGVLASTQSALADQHLEVCVDALARHTIGEHDLQVLDGFFEFLVSRSAKGAKGQFFTPRHVIEFCVRMLQPSSKDLILDPACGSGGFLIHALNYVMAQEHLSRAQIQPFCETNLWGFDIDPRAVRVARALMVLAGDGNANIIRLNSLRTPDMAGLFDVGSEDEPTLTAEDVCRARLRKHKGFDLILTNPPFAGEIRERGMLNSYSLGKDKPRVERDVLFVERCVDLLKPGGRMAIVLPHNKFAAETLSPMRKWILKKGRVLAVVGLGRHTFLPHTHQKASVLFFQKNTDRTLEDYPIFFAISERDGKDARGRYLLRNLEDDHRQSLWDRVDHDLDEVVIGFHEFLKSKGEAPWQLQA